MRLASILLTCLVIAAFGTFATGCTPEADEAAQQPAAEPVPAPEAAQAPPGADAVEPEAIPRPGDEAEADTPQGRTVTVYRDTWGVPHIYADSEYGAAYGVGYAQAEDRLDDIYINIRTAVGTMAEAFGRGPDDRWVRQDFIMRVVENAERCEAWWAGAPEHIRVLGRGYIDGVNAWLAAHPGAEPEFAFPLEPWMTAAVGRAMILRWPLGRIQDEMERKDEAPGFGSNGWAVAPERTAGDFAILLTDPHLTWEGLAVFHEARVHAPDLPMCGYFLVGSPLMALGHNSYVGWASTTGGPDTSDVYQLKLNPKNPLQYELDGEWLTADLRMIRINIRGEDPVSQRIADTRWGPVFEEPDMENHVAYAAASPYLDNMDLFEQQYRMIKARNAGEFFEAVSMNAFMEQNLIWADRAGTIAYVRTGRVPIRPKGYDWSVPVPGHTTATEWQGIHPIRDLVHIADPEQGYMQNCNVSPANMMENSPLQPAGYPEYIYNVSWDDTNPRGERALQLLSGNDAITREQAKAYATDVYDILAAPWQEALREAWEAVGEAHGAKTGLVAAVEDLLAWDGRYTPDSTAATTMRFWRERAAAEVDTVAIAEGKGLPIEQVALLVDSLEQTVNELEATYGTAQVPWGDIHRIGRGDQLYPAPGADYGSKSRRTFTETLFDVRGDASGDPPVYVANNGSFATMLMFFESDGVEAWSITMWGQSDDPGSPHFTDQARELYATRTFKPTWFDRESLMDNVASEQVLALP